MNLQHKTVDGEVLIRDLDTDNGDLMAIVPLTGDEKHDNEVLSPFIESICSTPALISCLKKLVQAIGYVEDTPANQVVNHSKEDSFWVAGNIGHSTITQARELLESLKP